MRLTELFKAKERADVERLWDESERLARFCTGSDAGLDENAAIELICSAARNVVGADGASSCGKASWFTMPGKTASHRCGPA